MKDLEYTVSINCLAFNHEKFIRQCLDGFLMQKTNFNFEILIHDDASTDNTASIIREYEEKYRDVIFPIYQKENQYSKGKSISATINFPRARGKYIAMCEGDDYWTDPLKLQKQVDFLEANADYALCFHRAKVVDTESTVLPNQELGQRLTKHTYGVQAFHNGNFIPTASVIFRSGLLPPISFFEDFKIGDWPLFWYMLKDNKKAYFFKETMSVYRKHRGGVNSSISKIKACSFAIDTLEKLKIKIPNDRRTMNKAILMFRSSILRQLINVDRVENQSKINTVLKDILSIWGGWSSIHFQIKALILVKFSWLLRIRGSQASL